jgi:ribosome-interacting GTPase 1
MMLYEDCPFQLIDLPPITADFMDPSTIGLVRGADIAFLMIDLASDSVLEDTQAVLARFDGSKTRLAAQSYLDEEDMGVSYTQTFIVLNKCECAGADERLSMLEEFVLSGLTMERHKVSALNGSGLNELRKRVFEALEVVRVYTKHPKQKEPDMTKPFTIRRGETLVEVAEQVHRDMADSLKGARVWGKAVHDGTQVKPDYAPLDGDIVELHGG